MYFQLIRIFKSSELREENCYLVLFAVQGMIFGPPIVLRKADLLVLVQLWNQPTRGHRSLDFFFFPLFFIEGGFCLVLLAEKVQILLGYD